MNIRILFFTIASVFLITCSDDSGKVMVNPSIEIKPYFGTYLYEDSQCSGADIQYATIDESGVSFFDFLGDNCDDTTDCYSFDLYEIVEVSSDTLLIMTDGDSDIDNGMILLDSDSLMIVSYVGSNGPEEYSWKKIKDDIYSFTPLCDEEYQNTKDIADILVYAVSDNGDLLWKNYIHGGIWDLGSSVTPTQDGGFLVLAELDGVSYGGCCYSYDPDTRDIIKLDNKGEIQWKREITYSSYGILDWRIVMAKSLFETSQGDLVFLAPTQVGMGLTVVMMDQDGELIWSSEIPDIYMWNYNAKIMMNSNGNLVVIAGPGPSKLVLIEYTDGSILFQKEYPGLGYPRSIISVGMDMVIVGQTEEVDTLDYEPIFLLKTDAQGLEIWTKIWDQEAEKVFGVLDVIETDDGGFMIFCMTDPAPYATIIKTDSGGNEEWRRKYDDYVGGGQGWLHQTDDGGFFMASGYGVTKLNPLGYVEWSAACSSCFQKVFNNGIVSGINHDMKPIQGGAVLTGYGSEDWE